MERTRAQVCVCSVKPLYKHINQKKIQQDEMREKNEHTNESSSNSSESIKCNGNQRLLLIPTVVNLMHANSFTLRVGNDDVYFVPNSLAASAQHFEVIKVHFVATENERNDHNDTSAHSHYYLRSMHSPSLTTVAACLRSIDELENKIYFRLRPFGPPHVPCIPLRQTIITEFYGWNGLLNSQNAICPSEKTTISKSIKFNSPMYSRARARRVRVYK